MDFHQFEKNWTDQDYQDLAQLIVKRIGKDKLIPSSAQAQSLKEIWKTSGRVVVGSREFRGNVSSYPFWSNSVEQFWCGSSVTTWSTVQTYMQNTLDHMNIPKDHLWALMAQYNYMAPAIAVPAYVPEEISSFFAGLNGIKANIIDTDWWNRVNTEIGHTESRVPNFSALINAVPLNLIKGYRRNNQMSLWDNDRLLGGADQFLAVNDVLVSKNNKYKLVYQSDGNLVLYRAVDNHPLWATNTNGKPVWRVYIQPDGNFVVYETDKNPVWASNTAGHSDSVIIMQDDGNLVIYDKVGKSIWASNTVNQ